MPIYEYECKSCGAVFEVIQSVSAPDPGQCQVCQKGPVQKLISRSGFVLKGGGFYTNEYPSTSRKEGMKSEK